MKIIGGAGRNKTILSGYCFQIKGKKDKRKRVELKDMTMKGSSYNGLSVLLAPQLNLFSMMTIKNS